MDQQKRERLIEIIREKSYREGDFTLVSGKKSKFYIDMKATTLHPEGAKLLGELAVELLQSTGMGIDAVGGLTLGADPIATSVSLAAFNQGIHWPAFIVRKESKGHGTGKYIEGTENLKQGARCVVLEDVVTTGQSSIAAVERLRCEGYHPVAIFTVVDREQGGEEGASRMGLKLFSLFKLSEIQKK